MSAYRITKCTSLLDGGSIHLDLVDNEGNHEFIKLDKEIGSPTEGNVFATMLNKSQPLSKKEQQKSLKILLNTVADTDNQKWHVKIITDHLRGISPSSSNRLSQHDIDNLLQDP
ncbi:MAG: hypothetical protein C0624_00685 [Desulfuromonas sp.]|nr:MAG: hypothetical protein C0624_00685 [Desulfuromonas sp.]